MIRVVIVDDEAPARDRLRKLLIRFEDIEIVGEAQDGISALSLIGEQKPHVAFLDIEMPGLNGLEVAQTLGLNGPATVFVTAYDDRALAAFEAHAADYLVKPVNEQRLEQAIEKLRRLSPIGRPSLPEALLQTPNSRLAVKIGAKYQVFDPSQIKAVVTRDHYSALLIDNRELLCDEPLEQLLKRLDSSLFIRVHRSAILNTKFLKELRRDGDRKFSAILLDRTEIAVSRERLPALKRFLGLNQSAR